MNREALVLYLQQIRNLEVTKVCLTDKFQKEKRSRSGAIRNCEKAEFPHRSYPPKKDTSSVPIIILGLALCIALPISIIIIVYSNRIAGLCCLGAVIALCALAIFIGTYSSKKEKSRQLAAQRAVDEYNQRQDEDARRNQVRIQSLNSQLVTSSRQYHKEYGEATSLLDKLYSLNIIPNQYRNLASIYYIYDYMSSSNATLEETLMHEHMENGIHRLEAKLDTMTGVLYAILDETRRIADSSQQIANNTRNMANSMAGIFNQNQQMLASLAQSEENSRLAAQYSAISAYYDMVNSYYRCSTYLR